MGVDWNALLSTFGLVFLAELGDKTQLAVVTQVCKFRRPWAVFLGASLALTAVTAIGAWGGQLVSQFVPALALRVVAALAFILMGAFIGWEAIRSRSGSGEWDAACQPCLDEGERQASAQHWKAFTSTLGLLFVAELGDKTQLAVLSLAGQHENATAVLLGGALALTTVTGLGVVGGQGLCRLVPERWLLIISAIAFVVMGVLMGVGVL